CGVFKAMALARAGGSMSSPRVIARQGPAHLMSLLCRFCRPERLTAFNVEKAQAGKGLSLTNSPRRTRVPQQTDKIVTIGNLCQPCYSELEIYIPGEGLGDAYTKRQFDRRA